MFAVDKRYLLLYATKFSSECGLGAYIDKLFAILEQRSKGNK